MPSKGKESKKRVLLLFYSKTGKTRRVMGVMGEALSGRYNVESVEVRPKVEMGFFRSIKLAKRGETVEVEELKVNPEDYDLVVLGTPVWSGCPPPPINTVMKTFSGLSGRRVAVVATCAFSAGVTVKKIVEWVKSSGGELAGSLVVKTLLGVRGKAVKKVEEFSKNL